MMLLHTPSSRIIVNSVLVPALFMLLSACTPTLNWRNVQLDTSNGGSLKATLPCKPDAATRKQQLGDIQVDLSMMGCVANEMTFTLSCIHVKNPLDAPKVLAAWQAAAVSNVGNVGAMPATMSAVRVAGAGTWPPASSVTLIGANTQANILWFAKQTAVGVTLYQAALYGKKSSKEANATFFESLQLQ